jgi:hypothetical protein
MFDREDIRARIKEVAVAKGSLSPTAAADVAFYMTDWLSDLDACVKFFRTPDDLTVDQVHALLVAFLVHVPNHLAAAAKLYVDSPVSDVFGVGAVSVDGDPK